MPTNQVTLLNLWDRLGIPHKEKKQLFGSKLTIIGIEVDADELTLTLPDENRSELIAQLYDFSRTPVKTGVKYTLKDFQRLAGSCRMVQLGPECLPTLKTCLIECVC